MAPPRGLSRSAKPILLRNARSLAKGVTEPSRKHHKSERRNQHEERGNSLARTPIVVSWRRDPLVEFVRVCDPAFEYPL